MTVRQSMAYSEVEISDLDALIENPNIAVEQKVDGTRALVVIQSWADRPPLIQFLHRSGGALKHTAAMQHFDKIAAALAPHFPQEGEAVIDGEVMIDTGEFVAFDLPYMKVLNMQVMWPEDTYRDRRQLLHSVLIGAERPLRVAPSAMWSHSKRELIDRVRLSGGEGVMLKALDSPYEPGKRVKHSVKAKFVKTADVVVTASSRGRNEAGREIGGFTFGVNTDEFGKPFVTLGSCSAIGKPEVKVGDVIEVAYLYRPEGGGLVQPRMKRVRTDKAPADCTLDQFPIYSKAVL
jgi:ATP-dependent DNA ligase